MSTATVGRAKHGARHRGRRNTAARRQRVGRVSGVAMACGYVYTALFLAPGYSIPLLFMAAFVLIGGAVMDLTADSATLAQRLIGPGLALSGLVVVVWMLVGV